MLRIVAGHRGHAAISHYSPFSQVLRSAGTYGSTQITKELSVKRIPVFLSALASSSLLQTLGNICLVMDPKLPPEDKAKRLYPDNPALGNRYLILIGECIVCWAERHPLNSQLTSSKFSLLLKSLVDKGVLLPQQEFKYFH